MPKLKYQRILVKLSGEAFSSSTNAIDHARLGVIVRELKALRLLRVETALVVGGGNIWRKRDSGRGLPERTADYLGLLATIMNGLMLSEALRHANVPCILQSPLAADVPGVVPVDLVAARGALRRSEIVIFAAGTGEPGFTTDTGAAKRAVDIRAEVIVKVGPIDGVYTADPHKTKRAKKYTELSIAEALRRKLGVMDKEAFQICAKSDIPIIVCRWSSGVLKKVALGDQVGTLVKP